MFSSSDTIVAIATPAGRGALGVVRLSGPAALPIALHLLGRTRPLEPRRATFSRFSGQGIDDQVIATFFKTPHSYTGDDVVELSAHGSPVVLKAILASALGCGARLAQPGEFTLRAYVNGKLDLIQAEAVGDLIDAATPLQARAAFDQLNGTLTTEILDIDRELFDLIAKLEASIDFPDEGYHFVGPDEATQTLRHVADRIDALLRASARGRLIREGVQVVISGRPNAGKSRLFNALVGAHRAIVSDTPGTTRDLLSEVVDFDGLRVTLIDTAGLTESDDPIEQEGVRRARAALTQADLVLRVIDSTQARLRDEVASSGSGSPECSGLELLIASKADLPAVWYDADAIRVSAETGAGIEQLVSAISQRLFGEQKTKEPLVVTNLRHIELLKRAEAALRGALDGLADRGTAISEEFLLVDLQEARTALEEVSGRRTPDDLLIHIFSHFCIGK